MLRALFHSLFMILLAASACGAPPDEETTQWIGQVLLGGEYHKKFAHVSRWTTSPTLSLLDANAEETRIAEGVVSHLNETLAHTAIKGIRLVAPGNYDAHILVRFAPLAELPRIANRHGINYIEGNWGFFTVYRKGSRRINRAVVLIASDKLKGNLLRHFLLEEITQALGPMNDSPLFADSIFYSKNLRTGNPTELSARDRRLLLFLYNHLSPGTKPDELLAAIHRHWETP